MNNKLFILIKVTISALLIFAVIRFFGISGGSLLRTVARADAKYLVGAFALLSLNLSLQLFKWHYLLRAHYSDTKLLQSLKSLLGGFPLGLITPGRLGELGRALFHENSQKLRLTGIVMIDKTYSYAGYLFVGSIGIAVHFINNFKPEIPPVWLIITLTFAFNAFLLFNIMNPRILKALAGKLRSVKRFETLFKNLSESVRILRARDFLLVAGVAAMNWVVMIVQYWLLLSSFRHTPFLSCAAAAATAQTLKTLLPIGFGDVGVREASAVYFFGQIGIDETAAFGAALLLFSINVLIPAVAGLPLIPMLKLSKDKASEINHTVEKSGMP